MTDCGVCNDESGEPFVGVAAVPGAPFSVGWCRGCLVHHAVPVYVVESWLFLEFDAKYMRANGQEPLPMPEEPPECPLPAWAQEQTVWLGGGYQKIGEAFPVLWKRERERQMAEDDEAKPEEHLSERASIAPDVEVPEEVERRLREGEADDAKDLEE